MHVFSLADSCRLVGRGHERTQTPALTSISYLLSRFWTAALSRAVQASPSLTRHQLRPMPGAARTHTARGCGGTTSEGATRRAKCDESPQCVAMARAVCMLPQRLDECVQYAHFPLCPVGHAAREAREVLGAPTSLLAQHGFRRLVVSRAHRCLGLRTWCGPELVIYEFPTDLCDESYATSRPTGEAAPAGGIIRLHQCSCARAAPPFTGQGVSLTRALV